MTVKSAQTWSGLVVCKDSTGALATPSVGPAGTLYVDGTSNAASVTVSGSNPYKWTVTLPTLTAGQCVSMYITATIATIATASVVAEDVADTVRTSDVTAVLPSAAAGAAGGLPVLDANLVSAANVTYWKGVAPTELAAGNVQADISAIAANTAAPTSLRYMLTGEVPNRTLYAYVSRVDGFSSDARLVIRDTMKLAPSAGDSDAGSVDAHLDDLLTYAAANEPADIWGYVTRTLTQGSTTTSDATASGAITRKRGNSWSISLTLGAITGYTSLWFTVKRSYDDADSAALLQVKLNSPSAADGLLYVNGATATDATKASITVSDATTGAIVVAVDETITDDLAPGTYYYDVQALISGSVSTPDAGTFTLTADVTRSVT